MSRTYKKISELIDEISMGPFGSDIKVEYFEKQGVPVLNGSNIAGVKLKDGFTNFVSHERAKGYKKAVAKRGDIVITHRGTLGQIAYVPDESEYEEYVISQSQFRVSLKVELINPIYFAYYFHTNEGQKRLLSFKSHVGVPALAQATTNFRLLDFPVRPKREQDAIANVLESIDQKIELNNRINAELEAMAKTLYDYWFVQFDFPDDSPQGQGKPYKSSGGKMVYNPTLKREIPQGWSALPLSKHLDCNKKKLGKKHNLKTINYLDTANLTNNIVGSIQKLDVGVDNIPSRANMLVSKNDILYSTVRPNQLHYGIVKDPIDNMIASTGFAVLTHKAQSELNVIFYLHITSSQNTSRLIKISESSKSSYPSISPDDILNLTIALPSESKILKRLSELLNPFFEKVSEVQKETNELEKLRDWLLPMLMSGQVTVG